MFSSDAFDCSFLCKKKIIIKKITQPSHIINKGPTRVEVFRLYLNPHSKCSLQAVVTPSTPSCDPPSPPAHKPLFWCMFLTAHTAQNTK